MCLIEVSEVSNQSVSDSTLVSIEESHDRTSPESLVDQFMKMRGKQKLSENSDSKSVSRPGLF